MSQILADSLTSDSLKRREAFRDLATGVLSLAVAAFLLVVHFRQTGRLHQDYGTEPGPALMPELLLVTLAFIGATFITRGLIVRVSAAVAGDVGVDDSQSSSVWAFSVFGIAIISCLIYSVAGFGVAACAMGLSLCSLLAYQEGRPVIRAALEGLVLALLFYSAFRFLLSVPLT